ncbi:uncharacterized protein LOC130672938 [Microplitis mediator]|uniref:uncharacterized protein LOC130672938 n=1 Tax=Microplitis mediator TaxID=375433 RepID=UPI0025553D45|nr:uncharacterized protein LOC130672938 [Microplitis mediator]XP_057333735.1 uncharacterized protein LOC130672938 [Microplitis mediator]XP_057333737.1 uncharacterized protein LOC130672938 [Microplitis mediator]
MATSQKGNFTTIFNTFEDGFSHIDSVVKKEGETSIKRGQMVLNVSKVSSSPVETLQFLKDNASINASFCPLIVAYGRSGSGKSSLIFGRDGSPFPGLARSWFPPDNQVNIKVMEFINWRYNDMVRRWSGEANFQSTKPIDDLAETSIANLLDVLKTQTLAATRNNKQSTRGFISITLTNTSTNTHLTILDMPGTENASDLDERGLNDQQKKKLRINSSFTMKTLSCFTDIIRNGRSTLGNRHFFQSLVERVRVVDVRNVFLIVCAASPLTYNSSSEAINFLANIPYILDPNFQRGRSRSPRPSSAMRLSPRPGGQQNLQLSPLPDRLRQEIEQLKKELQAAQEKIVQQAEQNAKLAEQNAQQVEQFLEKTRILNELQQNVHDINEELAAVKRSVEELQQDRGQNRNNIEGRTEGLLRQINLRRSMSLAGARRGSVGLHLGGDDDDDGDGNASDEAGDENAGDEARGGNDDDDGDGNASDEAGDENAGDEARGGNDDDDGDGNASDEAGDENAGDEAGDENAGDEARGGNDDDDGDGNASDEAGDENAGDEAGDENAGDEARRGNDDDDGDGNASDEAGDENAGDEAGDENAGDEARGGNDDDDGDGNASDEAGDENAGDEARGGNDDDDGVDRDDFIENNDWAAAFDNEENNKIGIKGLLVPAFHWCGRYYQVFDKVKFADIQWDEIIHEGGRGNHVCHLCKKQFQSSTIKLHVWADHNRGDFYCSVCKFKYRGLDHTHVHELNCDGFVYECIRCGEKINSRFLAKRHRKKCTPELPPDKALDKKKKKKRR